MTHALPIHPVLVDPRTGDPLRAIYRTRSGRLVWPVMGASPDDPSNPPAAPPAPAPAPPQPPAPPAAPGPAADPPKPDPEPLGDAGKKALETEREARKAAEKELAKYRKAEQDKADKDKSEAERRTAAEARAEAAELRALRLEVASEKGLTAAQAKRLMGATREELEKDAEEILLAFPVAGPAPAGPTAPKPDPTQGPRGDPKTRTTSLNAAVSTALGKK